MGGARGIDSTAMAPQGDELAGKAAEFPVTVDPADLATHAAARPADDAERENGDPVTGLPKALRAFVVCKDPKVILVPGALADAECDHVLDLAAGVEMSSSTSCCLRPQQTGIIERIERRLATLAGQPVAHLERLVVHRCMPNEVPNTNQFKHPSQTCLLFVQLAELESGGELELPVLAFKCTPRRGAAILWPSTLPDAQEDTRLVHRVAASPQANSLLVASFHCQKVRLLLEAGPSTAFSDAYHIDVQQMAGIRASAPDAAGSSGTSTPFLLGTDPRIKVAAKLLTAEDVARVLSCRSEGNDGCPVPPFQQGSVSLRAAIPFDGLEEKICSLCDFWPEALESLRIVQTPMVPELCNRGCGKEEVYICLSEQEEVLFPNLGVRLTLRAGDALLIPNVNESAGHPLEEVRGVHSHHIQDVLSGDSTAKRSLGLQVNFASPYVPIETLAPLPPLSPGLVLQLGTFSGKLTKPKGMGSFGAVWGAKALTGSTPGNAVIKEIVCDHAGLEDSNREVRLLQMLLDGGEEGGGDENASLWKRVPRILGSHQEKVQLLPPVWRTRVAMTEVAGMPLDHFLLKQAETTSPAAGSTNPGDLVGRVAEASNFAMALLSQLAPVLRYISKHLVHRDVNAHNILVEGSLSDPQFALVDFGLAVELEQWRARSGASSCSNANVGGDSRYWPMSAWIMLVCGWPELSQYPQLQWEYETHLDFQGLGITALQSFHSILGPEGLDEELSKLNAAWVAYWDYTTQSWKRIFGAFQSGSAEGINAAKLALLEEGVYNTIARTLGGVRSAWRSIGQATSSGADTRPLPPGKLAASLLELLSAGAKVGLEEGVHAPDWAVLDDLLNKNTLRGADGGSLRLFVS
mmetsp:Transcript_5830/g.13900  ORF Transcript_5830/g.13900 Transcript_5830/m.13900 type:complete len:863 (-) Transcript_5830:99-2687(-)